MPQASRYGVTPRRACSCSRRESARAAAGAAPPVTAVRIARASRRSSAAAGAQRWRHCGRCARASRPRGDLQRHDPDRLPRQLAFGAERPGVWFHPSGYGALGYALPAAIGARAPTGSAHRRTRRGLRRSVHATGADTRRGARSDAADLVGNNGASRADPRGHARPQELLRSARGAQPRFVALAHACGAAGGGYMAPALAAELRAALDRPGPTLLEAVAGDFRMP